MADRSSHSQSLLVLMVALLLATVQPATTQGAYDGAVRLIGGSSQNEGHVEFHYRGVWRAVCDSTWNITNGNVVCQQLGFPGAIRATRNSYFPFSNEESSMITLSDTHCSGNEPSLALCRNSWQAGGCNSSHHAGVICKDPLEYSLRLSVTTEENRGYLEVSLSGEWLRVLADEYWDLSQADFICSQLGFQYATSVNPVLVLEGQDAQRDLRKFSTLRCWLAEGNRSCNSSAPFGSGDDNGTSGDDSLRPLEIQCNAYQLTLGRHSKLLANTASLILRNNTKVIHPIRSVICDNEWTLNDAMVVCRQLGFAGADEASLQRHRLASSNVYKLRTPICDGDEDSIEQCGRSVWSSEPCMNGTSAAVRCTSPTATIASFTHINASATRIQWTVDNLPQSRIINGYTLKYTATTTGSTLTVETAGQLNHAVLSGLMPFTEYTVLIRMRTVHGEGKWSNSRHFMTLPSVPKVHPIVYNISSPSPRNITITVKPASEYSQVNGEFQGYIVEYRTAGSQEPTQTLRQSSNLSDTVIGIGGLQAFTEYKVRLAVWNDVGDGPFTTPFTVTTQDDVPSSVPRFNTTIQSPTSVALSWEEPESPNGIITSFVCRYVSVTVGINHEGERNFSGTARESVLTNLEEYVKYSLIMYATTVKGQGEGSKEKFVTTLPDGPVASPTFVKLNSVSSTRLTVSWQPPSIWDQNGPITSYKIRYYTTSSTPVKLITEMLNVDPNLSLNESWQFNYTVVKLLENTQYSVAVAAENKQGEGPYSEEEVIQLPATSLTPTYGTPSTEPTIVAVTMVVLILAIALIAAVTSLYLCVKRKQLKSRFERHFKSKDCKGSHIYEEPKCSSAARGTSIENIYDVCGTPGRMSMQEEDYPERSETEQPTLNATNMLFTGHTASTLHTGDDVHSWASLPEVGPSQTPDFLDNPLYQPCPVDLTCADQPTEGHGTAERLVGSVSHGASTKGGYSTIPRRKSPQQSATMAFSEPVTMSHLKSQEQQYDRLAPYRHLSYPSEPHSASSTLSPGILLPALHARPHDKVIYQNISDMAPLPEGKDSGSLGEFDYVHIYDAPRKGRDIYAVPRSCIAMFSSDENGADSSVSSAVVCDPNSDPYPSLTSNAVPTEPESESQ